MQMEKWCLLENGDDCNGDYCVSVLILGAYHVMKQNDFYWKKIDDNTYSIISGTFWYYSSSSHFLPVLNSRL